MHVEMMIVKFGSYHEFDLDWVGKK